MTAYPMNAVKAISLDKFLAAPKELSEIIFKEQIMCSQAENNVNFDLSCPQLLVVLISHAIK